jgi:rod shape determining protein RodA
MMRTAIDWTLLIVALLLAVIGILLIYTVSPTSRFWTKQAIYLGVGLVAMFIAWRIPMRVHYSIGWIYYAILIVLLGAVLVQSGEVKRWLNLGFVSFQPSEFAKVLMVFAIGRFLYDHKREIETPKVIIGAILLTAVPFAIVMGQPDLGTSMVFTAILVTMLYTAGLQEITLLILASPFLSMVSAVHWIPWAIYFVLLILILWFTRTRLALFLPVIIVNLALGVLTPAIWRSIHDYQKERILVFLDPGRDPFGAGYQIIQSKIALGSGQFWGKGFMAGTQVNLAFLPARHTDFIFAVLGEQFGLIGCTIVLALFAVLFYRILRIADEARNLYTRMIAIGCGSILFFGAVVNIGMVSGVMPVTGLPLPFLSLGGTSLISSMFIIGLLQNIYAHGVEGP